MTQFDRAELRLLIEGLDAVRERMRHWIDVSASNCEEYNRVCRLQDRLINELESLPY